MSGVIRRAISIPQPREQVWNAIANRTALAQWMFPNDFEPRVGHRFTFRVPGNPEANFDGLTVHCEVLECEPPARLVFSWTAGGPVVDTKVSFRLEPEADGTRLFFEHAGFDITQPFGVHAVAGAEYGWARMFEQFESVVAQNERCICNDRTLTAPADKVFAAIENADTLARWWGPKGFTNTFEQFDFRPGGRWVFKMHAPNGVSHHNEMTFHDIQRNRRVALEHVVKPWFHLTITLTALDGQTHLTWAQRFESAQAADAVRAFCGEANEQVLDRLEAVLAE